MKKTYRLFILAYFAFLFTACTQEEHVIIDKTVNLSFSVDIDKFAVQTRSQGIDENSVTNLFVLVFDKDGSFLTRKQVDISQAPKFNVELPTSKNKRILHFIANYDWTNFDDVKVLHKNEGEILAPLQSKKLIMWNRTVLENGIDENSLSGKTISLIRNMSKITVTVDDNEDTKSFTPSAFTVFNSPTIGTIAPFNTQSSEFTVGAITVPVSVEYNKGHAYKDLTAPTPGPIYIYERNNSLVQDNSYTCVVVRGNYKDISGTESERYYKIDLIEIDPSTHVVGRLNIERNYWYKLTIKKVKREGYETEQEALLNAAANYSAIDAVIERYPVIADLHSKLEIEKTLFVITEDNYTLKTWAKYFPDSKTNVEKNNELSIHIQEADPSRPVFKNFSANPQGIITGDLSDPPSDGSTLAARIFVSKGDDLSRVIRVMLRKPYEMSAMFNKFGIKDTFAKVEKKQSAKAMLKFTIPSDYPKYLMPVNVDVYTQELYPGEPGLKTSIRGGKICYTYTATGSGEHKILFRTSMADRDGEIEVKIDRFTDFKIPFKPDGDYVYVD